MSYTGILKLAAPESFLILAALGVLLRDLGAARVETLLQRRRKAALGSLLGCLAAAGWILLAHPAGAAGPGMLVVDSLTNGIRLSLLALFAFTTILSIDGEFTDHIGEYSALMALATVGMMLMAGSENLLMIFVALELTSLSLYLLTAFNKREVKSAEAALKYFLFGGMAAAFTLFGLSLVYGAGGVLEIRKIPAALGTGGLDPLLAAALAMTVIGFGFKIAAVPFHLWAPDAYEGAPTPGAALIASGSKVAAFFVLAKVMMLGFGGQEGSGAWRGFVAGWVPLLAVLALLSMILGNLAAIVQVRVRRLLAYSAVAHAGYALIAVVSDSPIGVTSLIYYMVTYGLTAVGAFGVVGILESSGGDSRLSDFAGLSRRAPVLSACMLVFVLSLAGIPPLAGFFGKFYVFTAGASAGRFDLLWLVVAAVALSAVSLYYYLQILRQMYVEDPPESAFIPAASVAVRISVVVLALAVVGLGCAPGWMIGRLAAAVQAASMP